MNLATAPESTKSLDTAIASERLVAAMPEWSTRPRPLTSFVVGVLPGEGIGPEVMAVALDVLEVLTAALPFRVDVRTGGPIDVTAEHQVGSDLTGAVVAFCRRSV